MRLVNIFASLLLIFVSCENDDIIPVVEVPIGTYNGHFIRSSPLGKYAPSNVTLSFTADRFTGESDKIKYPAICNGTYKITGQEIEFINECAWTAEFDWTYILAANLNLA